MSKKTLRILGWSLTTILSLLFIFSASAKLSMNEMAVAQSSSMGFSPSAYRMIGVVEILSLILFIIPRTGTLGAFLLSAYMGGAIATHLQHQQPAGIAVAVQILLWITIVIRFPEFLERLKGFRKQPTE